MNTRDGTAFSRPPTADESELVTGMDKGQEMCGVIMMYYPHDPTVRYAAGGFISTHHQAELGVENALKGDTCYELHEDGSCKRKTRGD